MDLDLELELQYEHIDWNDIVEAELSGDQKTLELLRNRSVELKRSFSLPSPSPPPSTPPPLQSPRHHKSPSPRSNNHFRHPRKSRRPLGPKSLNFPRQNDQNRCGYRRSYSMQENVRNLLEDLDHSFPALLKCPERRDDPQLPDITSPSQGRTYAQVMGKSRVAKRTVSERNCFSPTGLPSKRSAIYGAVVTPTALKQGSKLSLGEDVGEILPFSTRWEEGEGGQPCSTPREGGVEEMETATPDNDSRSVKAGAAQRKLFPTPTQETPARKQSTSEQTEEERLTDPHRLGQRQKQIGYGKRTVGYEKYIQTVPRWKRHRGHPMTPDKNDPCSTRSWQGRIKVWRRALHEWDPPSSGGATDGADEAGAFTTEDASLCILDLSSDAGSQD